MGGGRRWTPWIALAVALAACGPSEAPRAGVTERDSAGVRIVESGSPSPEMLPWRISAEPELVIGAPEGEEADLLHRVFSARVLDGGRVLVSNSGSKELRIYDRSGRLDVSFGREGAGPGEFGGFSSMRIVDLSGDSVVVTDGANGRLLVFGLDGGFGRVVSPASIRGYGRPSIWGRFSGGGWLGFMPVGSGRLEGEPGDLIEMWFAFLAYGEDAAAAEELVRVRGRPRIVNRLRPGAIHFPFVPLTPEPVFSAAGDALLFNASGDPELRRVGRDGRLEAIFRWPAPRAPVDEIWSRYSTEMLEDVPEDRRPAYARLVRTSGLPVPESVPAMESVVVDDLGNVWVQRFRLPWTEERRWHVLAPDGEWLGDVVTPAGLTVLDIGADHLLGRHLDDLGVERVLLYGLER